MTVKFRIGIEFGSARAVWAPRAGMFLLAGCLFLIPVACGPGPEGHGEVNQEGMDSQLTRPLSSADYLVTDSVVNKGGVSSAVKVYQRQNNNGEYVILLPSLGRGIEDFTEQHGSTITLRMVESGYNVVLIQPRGVGKSQGSLDPNTLTLQDLASDITAVLDDLGIYSVHVVGHGFGGQLARVFAVLHPDRVDKLMLLACESNRMDDEARDCMDAAFDLSLPKARHLEKVGCGYFAEGHDPGVWEEGWYPALRAAQSAAVDRLAPSFYQAAGGKQFLLVQALDDRLASPGEAGHPLRNAFPDQVTYVEVQRAGHAMIAEQPDLIAGRLIMYIQNSPQ